MKAHPECRGCLPRFAWEAPTYKTTPAKQLRDKLRQQGRENYASCQLSGLPAPLRVGNPDPLGTGGQEVWIMMEDDAFLFSGGMKFFLPRQTEWYVIR